ncbi:54S ribosomal protein L17 mitochondrial [Aspergillus hancockii]|nr:54S ribosomal protein L17 mitochondrial [Aspergillus hancockii]
MDITHRTFPYFLPRILDDIATCSFVSIDFEFSGIATPPVGPNGGTRTLQERYDEVKRSADKYRIVQIGLTVCHEDHESGKYTLRPYNLYLSPIIDRKLDVERDLCFQSSVVEFLLENNFCLNALYKDGVHYLSREEETKAMAKATERFDRKSVHAVLDVKETELESLAFLKVARRLVDDWLALGKCGISTHLDKLRQTNIRAGIHHQNAKYNTQKIDHEAGYDSLLTAQVFIKLSAQLRDGGVSKLPTSVAGVNDQQVTTGLTLTAQEISKRTAGKESKLGKKASETLTASELRTKFDALETEVTNDQAKSVSLQQCSSIVVARKVANGELIPRKDAEFWKVYTYEDVIPIELSRKALSQRTGDRQLFLQYRESDNIDKTQLFSKHSRRHVVRIQWRQAHSVCFASCQETLVRRNHASAATPPSSEPITTGSTTFPVVKPVYTINAGVVLSRPPQITRDLTQFEKAYYFYQKRLNERLALPFTKYFYFKRGTPADEDWKRKLRERQTPARDIGKYNAYSKDAWNDELLVGAVESEPEHQVEMLVQDAEATVNATSQDTSKKEEIPRPFPRVTEADQKNDQKNLNRALQRTLYLLVQSKEGYWKFPSSPVEQEETLRLAAERTLAQSAGVNMNTWMVGFHPVGHHVYNFKRPRVDQATGAEHLGEKTFFMKSRIMTGQADLAANTQNLQDFKWLAKEEIAKFVLPQYYSNIKNMLAER